MTAAEALASEGDVPDNQGKKRKKKRKAIFSKQNITPHNIGSSSTPVTAQLEVISPPEEKAHDTPIIAINAEVAEQRKRDAFTQNLLAELNAPAPLRLKRPPAPKPTHKIAYHIDDLHTTLGMLLVRKGDMEKLNKIKSSTWTSNKKERTAIDKHVLADDKFLYDYSGKSRGLRARDLNKDIFPGIFPYERETAQHFANNKKSVLDVVSALHFVQKLHYESYLGDDPKRPKRKFDFRGNDVTIEGQTCQKILMLSAENRIIVSDDPSLRPEITPGFESMNQKNLLFKEYGKAFVARIHQPHTCLQQDKTYDDQLQDAQNEKDVTDELGMTSWQWLKEVVRQTLHPR